MIDDTIDTSKLEEFMGQMIGHMTGGAMCFGIWLGDELGLYRALADTRSATRRRPRRRRRCNARLVREWLDGQVAGGLIEWDASSDHVLDLSRRLRWRWPTRTHRRSSPGR